MRKLSLLLEVKRIESSVDVLGDILECHPFCSLSLVDKYCIREKLKKRYNIFFISKLFAEVRINYLKLLVQFSEIGI